VGARAVNHGDAQLALMQSIEKTPALHDLFRELIAFDDVNRSLVTRVTTVQYPGAAGTHPLTGARVPGELLKLDRGHPLAAGRGVLFALGAATGAPVAELVGGWSGRVDVWESAALENGPALLLARPDGFVAWAGDPADTAGLRSALGTWFGAPAK